MIVNLNTLCKVKLNELGKVIWMSQIDSLPEEIKTNQPEVIESIRKQIDSEGCVELELWGIMNVFGQYISPVQSPFEVNTIEIKKNPNFNPSQVD